MGSWQMELAGEDGAESAVAVAPEEKAHATPSRLSGLRGLFFALGLKEMKEASQPAAESSEAAAAPAPQPKVPDQTEPVQAAAVHAAPEPEAQGSTETAVPVANAVAPIPEPEYAFAAANGNGLHKDLPWRVTAEPEFLPPKLEKPTRRDRRDTFDDLQILPSWRGQYKKKG
jgi:hypothetical protein